jgi:hypothetical protein
LANTKVCKDCTQELPLESFGKLKSARDGREGKCRVCRKKQRMSHHSAICKQCGKSFNTDKKDTLYCSMACVGKSKHKRVLVNCSFCCKQKEIPENHFGRVENHYCDQSCYAEHMKVVRRGENNHNYNRKNVPCSGCGKETPVTPFRLENHKYFFCSNECYKENIGKYYTGENNPNYREAPKACCDYCGEVFSRNNAELNRAENNFCSRDCYFDWVRENKSITFLTIKCAYCGEEALRTPSSIKNKKNVYCSRECRHEHQSELYKREGHPLWDPSKSDEEREKGRNIPGYEEWRQSVYTRDKFTCVCCGDSRGGNLVAHHKDGYHWCKERRIDVTNGVTLCEECHSDFHDIHGFWYNTESQYSEWIHSKRKQDAI